MLSIIFQIPPEAENWLATFFMEEGSITHLIYFIIYYCLMGALISQFISNSLGFMAKSRGLRENTGQNSYYKGLGLFFFVIALSQIMYLIDAVNEQIYTLAEGLIFKADTDYDVYVGEELVRGFRSFWIFEEDKFVITFLLLFMSLPSLTKPLEKHILAQKRTLLTWVCRITAPLILIVRLLEIYSIPILGMQSFPGTETTPATPLYNIFAIFWFTVVMILFFVVMLLMQLYLNLGAKAPEGSKLKKRSKLIVIGLFIYIVAILTTQNAGRAVTRIGIGDDFWGPYFPVLFGFSTPILLFITLICLKKGFNREY